MTLKIRPAGAGDAEDIAALLRSPGAVCTDDGERGGALANVLSLLPERIAAGEVLLAAKAGRLLAATMFRPTDCWLEILCLAVAPLMEAGSIAALLSDRLIERARIAGLTQLRLRSAPSAVPLFDSLGFRAAGNGDGAAMQLCAGIDVTPVDQLDFTLVPDPWPFETANAPAIADHWRLLSAANPHLWNGRVLKLIDWRHDGAAVAGCLVETSYAAFLAWRDWGYPDPTAKNLFGSAVIRSRDGALIYGRMAHHTSTAGLVYPPGGSLDLDDCDAEGRVDVLGSIARELQEETGMPRTEFEAAGVFAIADGPRISIAEVLDSTLTADQLAARVAAHNTGLDRPELAEVVVLRTAADIAGLPMPPYAAAIARHLLA